MNKTSNQSSLLLPSFNIQMCACEHWAVAKQVRGIWVYVTCLDLKQEGIAPTVLHQSDHLAHQLTGKQLEFENEAEGKFGFVGFHYLYFCLQTEMWYYFSQNFGFMTLNIIQSN